MGNFYYRSRRFYNHMMNHDKSLFHALFIKLVHSTFPMFLSDSYPRSSHHDMKSCIRENGNDKPTSGSIGRHQMDPYLQMQRHRLCDAVECNPILHT